MEKPILAQLRSLAEPKYADFQRKIVTDTAYPILGVRMGSLQKLAKQYTPEGHILEAFTCLEEVMVTGLAIAYMRCPFEKKQVLLRQLLPHLDSWALTDSIVPTLKPKPQELPQVWALAMECLDMDGEFSRRFGIVLMLRYFLIEPYIPLVVQRITALEDNRYYVRMACAWLLAELAVLQPQVVVDILQSQSLDVFTHNMTIRKMREFYRITEEYKAAALLLRRKENNEKNYGN